MRRPEPVDTKRRPESESEDELNDSEKGEGEESEEETQSSEDEEQAEEDDDDIPGTPPTPPGTPPPEQIRQELATETVDKLFRIAKLRMVTPPRWTKVFLGAAQQYEKRLAEKREQLYMAVAQDDVELLLNIKKQVSEELLHWWAYDLLLVVRASFRIRPKTLEHLPDLIGDVYPGFRKVQAQRDALDEQLDEGNSISIAEMQLGMALLRPLQKHLEDCGEINVDNSGGLHGGVEELLNNRARGAWQEDDSTAAIGVNYGMSHVVFAGWRAIHFVAANIHAKESAIPALELLFKANADATLVEKGGATALHLAALRGNLNVVNCLLDNGCPLDAEDMAGCSAMNIAGRCRHYHLIKAFAQWLLPEDAWPKLFYTEAERLASHYSLPNGLALHVAVVRGSIEKVKELVNLEPPDTANVNYADPGGRRAVHLAAGFISDENVASDMLQLLVGQKADINARDTLYHETPLHLAARLGRATVVRILLLLHAHPNLPDSGSRTPMMLAAAGPDEERMPPAYNGTLVNKPLAWTTIQNLLDWNGRGDPPIKNGPQPRRVRGKAAANLQKLMGAKPPPAVLDTAINAKGKKVLVPAPEEEDDEDKDSDEEDETSYFNSTDTVRARAVALCDLGFDDQYIIDRDGRVNRGDRMQLFQHLFQADRAWIPEFPGDIAPLKPNDVRCRFVWKHLTGPLLQMAQKGNVPERATELLSYVLRVMLGNKGPAYGVFVSTGFDGGTLPLWVEIEAAIHTKTLDKRVEAVLAMGFVGGKPKLQSWVGSCWNLDEYPRNPVYAPWGAFEYLDKKDPDKPPLVILRKHEIYNKLPPKTGTTGQAFKDNFFTVFEPVQKSTSTAPIVCRQDRLCLANRLYVNETYGVRQQVEVRARLIGEMLMCPLLHDILNEIDTDGIAKENKDRRDILDYLGVAMAHPRDTYVYVDQPRRPFKDLWEDVEEKAVKIFCKEKDPVILELGPKEDSGRMHNKMLASKLKGAAKVAVGMISAGHGVTPASHSFMQNHKQDAKEAEAARHDLVTHVSAMPHESIEKLTKGAPPGDYGQFTLISDDDKRWLLRGESTRAFVELKRCSCIETCEEFSDLICSLAVGGLQDFHGRFWRATFGLFLWGRAKLLNPIFEVELQRRLPKSKTYELKGPFLRPRSDVLEICDLALKAKEDLALMSSEAPWEKKEKALVGWGMTEEKVRPPLDFNAGKPGGGVIWPTGIALYSGFTDLLHAEILCTNAAAMKKAFECITGPPSQNLSKRKSFQGRMSSASTNAGSTHSHMSMSGKEGRTKFTVLRVVNDFREDQQKVIPICAGIKLTACVGWTPLGYGPPIEQLVEIELMLKVAPQARWLAKYMDIIPAMMPATRNEDDEWKPQGK